MLLDMSFYEFTLISGNGQSWQSNVYRFSISNLHVVMDQG